MKKSLLGFGLAALAVFSSCVKEDGKDRGPVTPPPVVDNESIDKGVFDLLDRENEELKGVFALYDAGSYYYAASALLEHFRSRVPVEDDAVDLIAPTITSEQKQIATWALYKNNCKFYTEDFATSSGEPYAYLVSNAISWDKCESGDPEQTFELTRLAWVEAQGLAYRVEYDNSYATDWVKAMDSFVTFMDESDMLWRSEDATPRLSSLTSAWQYFVNAPALTPDAASKLLRYIAEDASRLEAEATAESGATLLRLATVFGEFKDAQKWYDTGKDIRNKGYRKEWFEALNLDFAGMEAVKAAYEANDYASAAVAMLAYWKQRSSAVNPLFTEPSSATDAEKAYAYYATKENAYRFYVKNYDEDASAYKPKSYLNASGDGINWQKWPSGNQPEERYQLNRHQWMPYQGKVYFLTKDESLVKSWMEVYQDWFRQNPEPDHEIDYTVYPQNLPEADRNYGWTWRPLDVAARIDNQFGLVEYFRKSTSITPAYLMWYLYQIDRQVNHVMKHYSTTDGNQRITQAAAVATAGLLFPEFKSASTWVTNASNEMNGAISDLYYADGWLKDGDFSYHISSIESFRSTLLTAIANGKADLFPSTVAAIKKMAGVVVNTTFPDYSSINMCDTRMESYTKNVLKKNFTRYAELFPDDAVFQWMATEGAQGSAPTNLMATYADAGYYVLRSGWTKTDMMMVLENATVSPKERWHRQWDNNTFELYIKGRRFFTDSGCYTYTTGTNRSKYAATSAHNTLTLNGANVSACKGTMLKSAEGVLVLENPSYTGLTHRRAVFLVENKFYVLVDEAYGNAEGTVNLNFHLPVAASASEVVVDAASASARTAFSDGNNILVKTFSPSTLSTELVDGFLSVNIDKSSARQSYKVNIAKQASDAAARYITVILPSSAPASESVSASFPADFSTDSVSARVTIGAKEYNLSVALK